MNTSSMVLNAATMLKWRTFFEGSYLWTGFARMLTSIEGNTSERSVVQDDL